MEQTGIPATKIARRIVRTTVAIAFAIAREGRNGGHRVVVIVFFLQEQGSVTAIVIDLV